MISSTLLLVAWTASLAATGHWPAFLGMGASPVDPASIPTAWSPTERIAWRTELPGYGQSSPTVWKEQVYLTSVEGPMKETYHVLALNLADGKVAWRQSVKSTAPAKNTTYASRAAPTPVVDAQGVYAFFESGDVVALDHQGQTLWTQSLANDYGKFKNTFGIAASPLLIGDAMVLLCDDQGPSYLLALDKRTGKTLWKTDRKSRTSWSSPVTVTIAGRPQIVCSSAGSVDGYDPASGKLLWSYDDVGGNTIVTPVSYAEGSFLVGASPGHHGENSTKARKSNFAMSVSAVGEKFEPRVLWRTEQAMPSFASPMVYRGQAYWVNRAGVVYCFDAATGKQHYNQRIKQGPWATPVGLGDRVYFFGKDGLTTVLRAGEKFELLAENELWTAEEAAAEAAAAEQAMKKAVDKPPGATKKPTDDKAAAPSGATDQKEGDNKATKRGEGGGSQFNSRTLYGVAMVDGHLLIRTGRLLYCLR